MVNMQITLGSCRSSLSVSISIVIPENKTKGSCLNDIMYCCRRTREILHVLHAKHGLKLYTRVMI